MQNEESQNKQASTVRSIYNYIMGLLWTGVGIFFLVAEDFLSFGSSNKVVTILFGTIAILYGFFRIYRGYKKK